MILATTQHKRRDLHCGVQSSCAGKEKHEVGQACAKQTVPIIINASVKLELFWPHLKRDISILCIHVWEHSK